MSSCRPAYRTRGPCSRSFPPSGSSAPATSSRTTSSTSSTQPAWTAYRWNCRDYARERGIIIADTKFEFGWLDDEVILIDECLTPDSSRFWPADQYKRGGPQPSFDKQYVRDYLTEIGWDREPPGPELPPGVIEKTAEKYREAFTRLTGRDLITP